VADAKKRAKRAGIPFDLDWRDLKIPTHCPIFGTPLKFTPRTRTDNTPSIDRIHPKRGYTKDNVLVISWRANKLKKDALDPNDLIKVGLFYRDLTDTSEIPFSP